MPTGQYKGSAIVGDMGLISSSKSIKSSGVPKVLSPERWCGRIVVVNASAV